MYGKFFLFGAIVKVASGILPFAMMPFIIDSLGIEDYGKYGLVNLISMLLLPFACLNIQSYQRKKSVQDPVKKNKYLLISLTTILTLFCLLCVPVYIGFDLIDLAGLYGVNGLFILFSSSMIAIHTSFETYVTTKLSSKSTVAFAAISQIFIWLGIYLFVVHYHSPYARLISFSLLAIFFLAIGSYRGLLSSHSMPVETSKFVKDGIRFSAPLAAISITELLLLHFDKLFVSYYLSGSDIGYYFSISQIASVLMFGFQAVLFPLEPLIYKGARKTIIVSISLLIFGGIVATGLVYALPQLIIGLLVGVVPDVYYHAFKFLLLGYFFKGIGLVLMPFLIRDEIHASVLKYLIIATLIYIPAQISVGIGFGVVATSILFLALNLFMFLILLSLVLRRPSKKDLSCE